MNIIKFVIIFSSNWNFNFNIYLIALLVIGKAKHRDVLFELIICAMMIALFGIVGEMDNWIFLIVFLIPVFYNVIDSFTIILTKEKP